MPIRRAFVKLAFEEVEAGCVRPGGKMEFLLERIWPSCYACCIFDIRCIINGLYFVYISLVPVQLVLGYLVD